MKNKINQGIRKYKKIPDIKKIKFITFNCPIDGKKIKIFTSIPANKRFFISKAEREKIKNEIRIDIKKGICHNSKNDFISKVYFYPLMKILSELLELKKENLRILAEQNTLYI